MLTIVIKNYFYSLPTSEKEQKELVRSIDVSVYICIVKGIIHNQSTMPINKSVQMISDFFQECHLPVYLLQAHNALRESTLARLFDFHAFVCIVTTYLLKLLRPFAP